jgi:hypothetical protein
LWTETGTRFLLRGLRAASSDLDTVPVLRAIRLSIIAKQATAVLHHGAKGQRRPDQKLIDEITSLRESGDIPWDAIVDDTRSPDDFTGFDTIADGVDTDLNVICLERLAADAPLVLTESRSLAGVLRAPIREHGAQIAPTNGQAAGFLHNDVVSRLRDGAPVLYLGDYDSRRQRHRGQHLTRS